jgi:hypothetical protein
MGDKIDGIPVGPSQESTHAAIPTNERWLLKLKPGRFGLSRNLGHVAATEVEQILRNMSLAEPDTAITTADYDDSVFGAAGDRMKSKFGIEA